MTSIKSVCKNLSDYRSQLMGFAIIWIIIYHSGLEFGNLFNYFKIIGFGGVDLFLFISGYGIFHSLERDDNVPRFYIKRFLRIYPAYTITVIVCFAFYTKEIILYDGGLKVYLIRLLGNLTMISQLKQWPYTFNWFVFCITLFYVISPLLHKIMIKYKNIGIIALFATSVALNYFGVRYFYEFRYTYCRVFIYLIGMLTAYLRFYHSDIKIPVYFFMLVSLLFTYSMKYNDSFYKFIFIIPGLILIMIDILKYAPTLFSDFLSAFGESSYEQYLINVTTAKPLTLYLGGLIGWSNVTHILGIAITVSLGFMFHFAIKKLNKYLSVVTRGL